MHGAGVAGSGGRLRTRFAYPNSAVARIVSRIGIDSFNFSEWGDFVFLGIEYELGGRDCIRGSAVARGSRDSQDLERDMTVPFLGGARFAVDPPQFPSPNA